MEVSGPTLHRARPTSTRGSGPAGSRCSGASGRRRLQRLVDVGLVAGGGGRVRPRPAHPAARRRRRRGRRGNERTPTEAVVAAGGHRPGRPADRPRPAGRGRGGSPSCRGCSEAQLHRGIDGAVVVDVTERTPVAVVGEGAEALLVDAEGRALGPAFGDPSRRGGARRDRRARRAPARPRRVPRRRRPPMPWRWPTRAGARRRASGWSSSLEDGRLAGRRRPGHRRSRFGDADQLEAKVRSLRTVLEQVDLTCAAMIDLRSPGSPVLTREEGCS